MPQRTSASLAILSPIWHTKPVIAKAVRQRIHATRRPTVKARSACCPRKRAAGRHVATVLVATRLQHWTPVRTGRYAEGLRG